VFTLILRVKVKLFTFNFWGGAKLFTVGCGEWFLRLPAPPMNNFVGTIREQREQTTQQKNLCSDVQTGPMTFGDDPLAGSGIAQ
jgi:hypothetical protein